MGEDKPRLWWRPWGRVPEVSARQLLEMLSEVAPQILDVRTRVEWSQGHLPGAQSAPITAFASALQRDAFDLDPTRPVVAVCLSAHRSPPAVRLLRNRGYEACQLAGGMRAWWAAKGPIER
ncbi:MAG: rhodanese-like domain-containing protein [Myxococcota bacterium]